MNTPQDRWPHERARLLAELAEAHRTAARAWECVARLLEALADRQREEVRHD